MKYWYQVLSTPTADSPGSTFILQYPSRKYVFGHVSEGTQRLFIEHGASMSHLSELFVTGKTTWANYGGSLGMILTLADARSNMESGSENDAHKKAAKKGFGQIDQPEDSPPKLTIHGGKNINHTLATARRFIFRKSLPISVKEYDSATLVREQEASAQADPFQKPQYMDENIKVWAMPLRTVEDLNSKSRIETRTGLKSPRKRSLNEFEEREDEPTTMDTQLQNHLLRQHIVKNMFDSDWKLDALYEENLPDVKMPAVAFIRDPDTKDLQRYTGPMPGGSEPVPNIKVLVRRPWPASRIEKLPATTPSSESLCYFVRSHDQRGKFDPKKALELGIPKGPNFARLARGESYTTEDGTVITSEMVLGPPREGKTVAFIDVPSIPYIDDLISRPEWESPTLTETLSCIFWILGPGVGDDARLVDFVSRMKNCDHVVSSTDNCPNRLMMHTATRSALRLWQINRDNFIVPFHDNVTLPQPGTRLDDLKDNVSPSQKLPWRASKPGLILDMEPTFGLNESSVIPEFDSHPVIDRMPRAVQQRLRVIQSRLQNPSVISKLLQSRKELPRLALESEVITLGTGSSSPSKYRNVSATLLHVPGKGYYLFDCGENTLGQLKRSYKPEEFRKVMQNLRMIWISHLHADHHLGSVSVIREWYEENYGRDRSVSGPATDDMNEILRENRLCVISDNAYIQWLEEYASVENFGFEKLLPLSAHRDSKDGLKTSFSYRHVQHDGSYEGETPKTTWLRFTDSSEHLTRLLRSTTGLTDVRTVFVNHCRGALAVTLEWDDGFTVSYSGDCRPSTKFAEIGKNSSLLIHEATFQNDLVGQAVAKKHSTAAEAMAIGRLMNAKMILLTHFSQRYAKISTIDDSGNTIRHTHDHRSHFKQRVGTLDVPDDDESGAGGLDEGLDTKDEINPSLVSASARKSRDSPIPVCMAFDFMKVPIQDIPIAQMFTPAFEKLIDRLEQAADEESLALREKERAVLEEKNPKKFGKKNGNKGGKLPVLPSRRPSIDRKKSAWSASESESGWSDSDIDKGHSPVNQAAL